MELLKIFKNGVKTAAQMHGIPVNAINTTAEVITNSITPEKKDNTESSISKELETPNSRLETFLNDLFIQIGFVVGKKGPRLKEDFSDLNSEYRAKYCKLMSDKILWLTLELIRLKSLLDKVHPGSDEEMTIRRKTEAIEVEIDFCSKDLSKDYKADETAIYRTCYLQLLNGYNGGRAEFMAIELKISKN